MTDLSIKIGENIHTARKTKGFTQETLAEIIGYTGKSVSKWESGSALPPTAALIALSKTLEITVDELLSDRKDIRYYLGIDGSGGKTQFALCDKNGTLLQSITLESTNPISAGFEESCAVLKKGIAEICRGIPFENISLYAGLSGGTAGDNLKRFEAFFANMHFAAHACGSNAELPVAAALEDSDGIAAILGIGHTVFIKKDGNISALAGYGERFDLSGDAYSIGRDAVCACLSAEEGSAAETYLCKIMRKRLCCEKVSDILPRLYKYTKNEIAELSTLVTEAARGGDKTAIFILQNNMKEISKLLNIAARRFPYGSEKTVVLCGSLTEYCDLLLPFIKNSLEHPEKFIFKTHPGGAMQGAFILAGLNKSK